MLPAVYDVTGKVGFITGAGGGIGKGMTQVLAAGADVVLNALTPRYVENTAAEIAKDTGRRVMPLLADVTKADYDQADPVSGWRIKPGNGMSNQPSACSRNLVLTALIADCFLPL